MLPEDINEDSSGDEDNEEWASHEVFLNGAMLTRVAGKFDTSNSASTISKASAESD